MTAPLYIGMDVQISRGVPFVIMKADGTIQDSGWFDADTASHQAKLLVKNLKPHNCIIGIDAPRMPLKTFRALKFQNGEWKKSPKGLIGRHCEIVVRTLKLANPQYTPTEQNAPEWMKLGFKLFEAVCQSGATVCETFPSASYTQLHQENITDTIPIPVHQLKPGPKDMLDAAICAYTVRRFDLGKGCEVGGSDGMGTIVLPCKVESHPVLTYPQS